MLIMPPFLAYGIGGRLFRLCTSLMIFAAKAVGISEKRMNCSMLIYPQLIPTFEDAKTVRENNVP